MPTNPPCPKQKKLTQWGIAVPTKKQGINNMNSKPLKTKKLPTPRIGLHIIKVKHRRKSYFINFFMNLHR